MYWILFVDEKDEDNVAVEGAYAHENDVDEALKRIPNPYIDENSKQWNIEIMRDFEDE